MCLKFYCNVYLNSKQLACMLFCCLAFNFSYSQQVSVAGGSDIQNAGSGSIAFSIGQVVYTQNDNGILYVAQGIQQPYEVFINFVSELFDKNSVSVFPNPFENDININFSNQNIEEYKAKLIDLQGNVIKELTFNEKLNKLYVGELSKGSYFIILENQLGGIYTIKLIKN